MLVEISFCAGKSQYHVIQVDHQAKPLVRSRDLQMPSRAFAVERRRTTSSAPKLERAGALQCHGAIWLRRAVHSGAASSAERFDRADRLDSGPSGVIELARRSAFF
jgi:hypothetical protein